MNASSRRRGLIALIVITMAALLSPSATAATPAHPRPVRVTVTGQVEHRRTYTVAQLRAFPQHTVTVQFGSASGTEQHTFTGPLLTDVASPRFDPAVKNDQLRFFVAATGTDKYRGHRVLG